MTFDKRQTNIAKGVATLLLLWHHLFSGSANGYTSLFVFHSMTIENILSGYCKVCVAIFLFLSGYGLYKSWQKNCKRYQPDNRSPKAKYYFVFVKNHLLKLMLNYWFVFLIFVPLGAFFGYQFWVIYDGNILYGILDALGLSCIFSTPTMNVTWWFMSTIILLYLLFPVMTRVMHVSPEILLAVSVFLMLMSTVVSVPFVGQFFIWFPPFTLGMYFAGQNGFETIRRNNETLPKQITLSVFLILLFAFVRFLLSDTAVCDALFALAVILFSFFVVSRIPFLSPAMEKLGKHSGSIFMFHTFIYLMYFEKFIYWFKYPPLIFIVLTVICYVVAVGLEALKKLVRYDTLVKKITS